MERPDYFELDIVEIAADIAANVPDVTSVRLFGSRKYPGKVRSDLDLLIAGPASLPSLLEFRNRLRHYKPLDLWLVYGTTATSAVNESVLTVEAVRSYELFPQPDPKLAPELRRQRFRADIQYAMTIIPPNSYVRVRGDHLGLSRRLPTLLDTNLINAADAIVEVIRNGLEAIRRMRKDGNAGRGSGTQLAVNNEYDVQNLTELLLAPIVSLQREPFTVVCGGIRRSADFSFAEGRLVLELKMSKNRGELGSALKQAQGILECYLDHPGVEVALAVLAVTPNANADKNAIESWTKIRGERHAIMRVITVPQEILAAT
jgi:hypothetical protein